MRKVKFVPGETYHLYNRGVNKQIIFHDSADWWRFLFLILHFQSPLTFDNIAKTIGGFSGQRHGKGHRVSSMKKAQAEIVAEIVAHRTVELIAFVIRPNHFHLVVKELAEGGISAYMQRILNAYTKYVNTKYQRTGHLFQGPFQSVHIEDNDQLLYTSAYIHRHGPPDYLWSSYQDYIKENRWPNLCRPSIILDQFETPAQYRDWVKTSGAKDSKDGKGHSVSFTDDEQK